LTVPSASIPEATAAAEAVASVVVVCRIRPQVQTPSGSVFAGGAFVVVVVAAQQQQ